VEGTLLCQRVRDAPPPLLTPSPLVRLCPYGPLEPLQGLALPASLQGPTSPCPTGLSALLVPRTHAGRWAIPRPGASKTQATRAVLLAWATPARLFPRRTMRPWRQRLRPSGLPSTVRTTERAPWMSTFRRERSPRLLIPSNSGLPPVECCRGTNPSYAAHSRPFLNVVASPPAATKAVAVKGPTPSSCASL
jgi:hypothetical protein